MSRQHRLNLFSALTALLPGDHIHAVAPINLHPAPREVTRSVIDAAKAKRERRAQRNLRNAGRGA
jgi:hypothetical protein